MQKKSGYDQTSSCEGQSYNPNGCGTTTSAFRGAATFEEIITNNSKIAITAFPNPVVNNLFVKLSLQNSGTVSVQMIDLSGRVVLNQQQQLMQGVHQLIVKGIKQQGITPGVYLLKITTADEIKTAKVVVQ